MSCQHLVCAACTGLVIEGRCPTCRAAREQVHHHGFSFSPQAVALIVVLLVALLALALHVHG